MRFKITIIVLVTISLSCCIALYGQDTFSICAVDTVTGEVGSAGASCISGSIILSDVHPGWGVVHTQAYYNSTNQNYARNLMNQHYSPQQIIDSLINHDAQNNPLIRQYGIVDLFNNGRSAAYTGSNCQNYKNHITGKTYSIQGNILLGQKVLDSMEARFLNTPGTLAEKLMAALQGAKIIGADTRCTQYNKSSISAFIRVAKPWDTLGTYYLNLNVNNTPTNKDPIDSLQVLFNQWLTGFKVVSTKIPSVIVLYQNYPNPFNAMTNVKFQMSNAGTAKITVYDILGKEVTTIVNEKLEPGTYQVRWNASEFPSGVYYLRMEVFEPTGRIKLFSDSKKLMLIK